MVQGLGLLAARLRVGAGVREGAKAWLPAGLSTYEPAAEEEKMHCR